MRSIAGIRTPSLGTCRVGLLLERLSGANAEEGEVPPLELELELLQNVTRFRVPSQEKKKTKNHVFFSLFD